MTQDQTTERFKQAQQYIRDGYSITDACKKAGMATGSYHYQALKAKKTPRSEATTWTNNTGYKYYFKKGQSEIWTNDFDAIKSLFEE